MKASSRANVVSSFTIIKGAMIEETYAVFAAWDFERSKRENLDRLREQNFIGAKSTAWLRDVAKVLNRRFDPAGRDRPLVMLAKRGLPVEEWKPLLLWHMTRDEFLVRDFLETWLFAAYDAGAFRVYTEDVEKYLGDISKRGGTTEHAWSEQTTKKLQVWPEEEQALSLKALPNHFRQFTHLPILKDEEVLKQSIAEGVSMGTFALCEGTTAEDAKVVHYKEKIASTGVSLDDGHLLIRAALAEQKLAEQKAKEAGATAIGTGPVGGVTVVAQPGGTSGLSATAGGMGLGTGLVDPTEPSTKPVGGSGKKARRVSLDAEVPFTDFHTFYTGVINALGRNADNIKIVVKVEASAENGFNPTVIEDTVKETLFNLFRFDDLLKVDEE